MFPLLDMPLRFTAFGLLLGLFVISVRDWHANLRGRLLALLCLTLMALMISTIPDAADLPPEIRMIARLVDTPNTVLVWLFAKSLLQENFKLNVPHIVLASIYCVILWFMWLNVYFDWSIISFWHGVILNLFAMSLFLHLVYVIISDWKNDLILSRRRLRLVFILTISIGVVGLIVSEIFAMSINRDILDLAKVITTLVLTLAGSMWFLQIKPEHKAIQTEGSVPAVEQFTEIEKKLHDRLLFQLEEKEVWRDPTLTIVRLAKEIGIGEHKLRKFINTKLGYGNFSRFLQTYRLAEAKRLLATPSKIDTQILNIAMDCGFNSISTFNRVFRESEQISPTAFRAKSDAKS